MIGVGDPAFVFRRQPLTSCCRRIKIMAKDPCHRHSEQALHKSKVTWPKFEPTKARTRCESISVPQDNPLDTRPQIGTTNFEIDRAHWMQRGRLCNWLTNLRISKRSTLQRNVPQREQHLWSSAYISEAVLGSSPMVPNGPRTAAH